MFAVRKDGLIVQVCVCDYAVIQVIAVMCYAHQARFLSSSGILLNYLSDLMFSE